MKERPILFSGEMVRAILEGRKTMTRRVVKHTPHADSPYFTFDGLAASCPYGHQGDRLWVKETFAIDTPHSLCTPIHYYASHGELSLDKRHDAGLLRKKPSIFMRRVYSRITLEIVSVRVERLLEITDDDARAEGVRVTWYGDNGPHEFDHIKPFASLWEKINGAGSWDANPWVWVIEFRREASDA